MVADGFMHGNGEEEPKGWWHGSLKGERWRRWGLCMKEERRTVALIEEWWRRRNEDAGEGEGQRREGEIKERKDVAVD